MKRAQSVIISSTLIASLIAFSLGWFLAKNVGPNGTLQALTTNSQTSGPITSVPHLDEVWGALQNDYYDAAKLQFPNLIAGAVKGFVQAIGDPYTVYMTPDESKEFDSDLDGELEGIGANLESRDGNLVVVSPLKNSPAQKAGILAGDIIYKINDEYAADMSIFDAINKIRGPKGSSVRLTIVREEKREPFEVTIKRDQILIDTITTEKLEGDIFHVSVNQFNEHTKKEFQSVIQEILLSKGNGLILDLRGNGGGYLDTSVDMLSELLDDKKTAVIIKKRDPKDDEQQLTSGSGKLSDIPMVVLIDKGSASASEIVAGALQDYKRAVLIGVTSFGKGSVQAIQKLNDGSTLRITIAKWFTPLGRTIHEVGIAPDIEVKVTPEDRAAKRDPQLEAAIKQLKTR